MITKIQSFIEKYDLLGCIQCGRCTGGCPVTVRSGLNVRKIVYQSIDENMLAQLASLNEIWDCTACHTCAVRCPKGLNPVEVLVGLRRLLVESGFIQPTARDALESVLREGNPWNKKRSARSDWMQGQKVKIAKPGQGVENLIFTCCTVSYDPKVQILAKNLVKILNMSGIDYGFIGEGETCCASEIYSMGEEGLFNAIAEENTSFLNSFAAKRIVTISPHCYAAFKKYYTGLNVEIIHYTVLLKELLENKQLEFAREYPKKIVFHDPCFLGKQNNIFEEPRFILGQIPGAEMLEFDRKKERSLCCEGGGGKMWLASESRAERLAEVRIADANKLGAELVAVACPFCISTLDDALRSKGLENELRVADILEIAGELI